MIYQILKTGKLQGFKRRKLTVGDSALVFTKDLEISFLDGLDIGRFRIGSMRCVRINQLSLQNYCCIIDITRANLPDLSNMVFTGAFVNFTCNGE